MKGLEELQPAWALPGFASGSSSFIPGMLGSRSSPGAGLPSWASCWSWDNLGKVTLSVGRGFLHSPELLQPAGVRKAASGEKLPRVSRLF